MEQQLLQRAENRDDKPQRSVKGSNPTVSSEDVVAAGTLKTDWYLAAFVGGAFTSQTSIVLERSNPFFVSVNRAKDVSVNTSQVVGVKAGLCPSYFLNLCGELEFDHFRPNIDEQQARGVVIGPGGTSPQAFVSNVDLSAWNLGLSAIARFGLLADSGYPLGKRLHFYLGGGPSFLWTEARSGSAPTGGREDSKFAVGVHALSGLKYFITKNLAVFGEYKFKHWEPHSFNLGADRFEPGSFNSHLYYLGLALHP